MADIYSDGTPRIGGGSVTINSVAYIYENLSITRPTTQSSDLKADGTPNREYSVAARVTGTMTLQLAASSTSIDLLHREFSLTEDSGIGAETFYVSNVDKPETQGQIAKLNIAFRKKYN
jgi:hypothetical protein